MPTKTSAGLLMYRETESGLTGFLAHPGGPFFRDKDRGYWTIPKGGVHEGEDLLEAGVREFEEETGIRPLPPYLPLGRTRQKNGKVVHAWAFVAPLSIGPLRSNSFELEWPPRSGRLALFPEIDDARFFPLVEAKERIMPAQVTFLEALENLVTSSRSGSTDTPAAIPPKH